MKHKVIIAGNHDLTFETALYDKKHAKVFHKSRSFNSEETKSFLLNGKEDGIYYLEDEGIQIEGDSLFFFVFVFCFCFSHFLISLILKFISKPFSLLTSPFSSLLLLLLFLLLPRSQLLGLSPIPMVLRLGFQCRTRTRHPQLLVKNPNQHRHSYDSWPSYWSWRYV